MGKKILQRGEREESENFKVIVKRECGNGNFRKEEGRRVYRWGKKVGIQVN